MYVLTTTHRQVSEEEEWRFRPSELAALCAAASMSFSAEGSEIADGEASTAGFFGMGGANRGADNEKKGAADKGEGGVPEGKKRGAGQGSGAGASGDTGGEGGAARGEGMEEEEGDEEEGEVRSRYRIYMCVCVYINKYMGEKMTSHGDAFCTLWVGSLMEDIESHICGGRDIYICVYV